MHIGFWWESQERDHLEDLEVGGSKVKLSLWEDNTKTDGMVWTGFNWLRIGTNEGL
jgi:hypothetical protein